MLLIFQWSNVLVSQKLSLSLAKQVLALPLSSPGRIWIYIQINLLVYVFRI